MKTIKITKSVWLLFAALLGSLTGCVGYVERPYHEVAYVQPPPVQIEAGLAVQDEYVYYPRYQVYYNSYRHHYTYRDGRSWVSRPSPPHVSAGVLFAAPSVRLDFHDSPANHHSAVARQYPKHWTPPGSSGSRRHGNQNSQNEAHRGGR